MENKQNQTPEEIRALLAAGKHIAIVGHVRPDGDCVCSCLSLFHYLRNVYHCEADVYLDPYAQAFSILPGIELVNPVRETPVYYDTVVSLDCADLGRIGAGNEFFRQAKTKIVIDHHISNPYYGDYHHIRGEIGSCCEVLYTLFEEEKLNRDMAVCLFTGMAHDTGIFQYSNVTPDTLRREAKLISFGFDFTDLIQSTFYQKALPSSKASGFAVARAEAVMDGFCVWSFITMEELKRFHTDASGVDSVVSELRNVEGADVAVFLYEIEPGTYKCSMRSNHVVNVSRLAMEFGGGGHVRAAGCTFHGMQPEEIIREITDRMRALEKLTV